MDLVDIDQVLDNLELREAADEHNKVVLQRNQLAANVSANNGSVAAPPQQKIIGNSTSFKGFVGVSQVFNSLDDYRKNVESLEATPLQKYDEECRRPITSTATQQTLNDYESQQKVKAENGPKVCGPKIVNENETGPLKQEHRREAPQSDNNSEDEEDDEEASNDIHKFIETPSSRALINAECEVDDVATPTSDSLTTSSSSTFSSGPSPGLASITDERSTPLTPTKDHERNSFSADEHQEQQHVMALSNRADCLLSPEDNVTVLDAIAIGLSSISITTANSASQSVLPCETTVSSVLKNVLEDLSETSSTSLLSQMRDQKPADSRSFPTVSPSYPENKELKDEDVPCVVREEVQAVTAANNELQYSPIRDCNTRHQPITFSSTMDEISDTELDSMLQEMDIDDIAENSTNNAKTTDSEQAAAKTEVLTKTGEGIEGSAMDDLEPNAADHMNADSFSQASTVEFSEVRAQTAPAAITVQGDEVHPSNSIASSYTSSESSLEGDAVGGSIAARQHGEELDVSSEESEERERTRPQRPTTLNLPALKMNLYANAGQTPPGINIDMTQPAPGAAKMQAEVLQDENDHIQNADNETIPNNDTGVAEAAGYSDPNANLGKVPPIWVPDNMAAGCMQCQTKFTMIKRRHHCRACGKVLCSLCCSQKFKLEFLTPPEARVCVQCYIILTQRQQEDTVTIDSIAVGGGVGEASAPTTDQGNARSPNPNNPMEYCSTIPPHRQVNASTVAQTPPSVIVPVGVLKKDGSYSSNSSNSSDKKGRKRKSVMFSDGIAPGSDLASMEHQWGLAKHARKGGQQQQARGSSSGVGNKPPTPTASKVPSSSDATTMEMVAQLFRGASNSSSTASNRNNDVGPIAANSSAPSGSKGDSAMRSRRLPPYGCDEQGSFIPKDDNSLPPLYAQRDDNNCDFDYKDVPNNYDLIRRLQRETLKFVVQKNFYVYVKIINLKCCMNRTVINFTTCGMHHVGNDELIILLEYEPPVSKEAMAEPPIPKDIFEHLQEIYRDAELGNPIAELSYTSPRASSFLGSRDYGGFIFIRATFQCLQDVIMAENPFLIGILIHRYEVPWAKVFPLRLMLRLGAQYRYYPCPHISIRKRESVYAEIAQTIINFLADFRNYSYTLPCIKGMYIHMEDRQTTVMIPRNRQDDVIKAINNSSDHILAFGGNFSKTADGHLVCMQNVNDVRAEMYAYSTQAINIQGQPRKITGASFFVLNEALKSTSGLSGKCSIVEDGLMVQILPTKMEEVRNALRNQKDIEIVCGPLEADEQQTEIVSIKWVENDRDFNVGVKSPIDDKSMEGVSSMRVHASFNYSNANYAIRLTNIYILKFDEWYNGAQATLATTSLDITRLSEQIARSASQALLPFLDLLATSGNSRIALRATLHQDNVCYEAGARGNKLPPLYMNALDNHLIPTLHSESSGIEEAIILELIFYILNV